jgi:hypothetical protein
MKIYFFFFLLVTQSLWAGQIFRNQSGFPVCFQNEDQVYIFDWDHIVSAQNKNVFYFKLSDYVQKRNHQILGCEEHKYIQNVPIEILKPIDEIKNEIPAEISAALEQVQRGGRLYRSESTTIEFINQNPNLFQADSPTQISILRQRYGDQFASELISTWSKNMFSEKTSCDSLIGSCDYYLCAENKSPCGLDGYNIGFGFKYCSGSKFKLAREMKTVEGQQWVQSVFQCLQKQSFSDVQAGRNNSCDGLKKNAFDSHPNCYAQAGFCNLKFSEKINIFKLIKSEIFSHATIEQGLALMNLCQISNAEKFDLQQELTRDGHSEK